MLPNRPELALLRGKTTPDAFDRWVTVFAAGDRQRAERYAEVAARFRPRPGEPEEGVLGGFAPRTRERYSAAIVEFFEWAAEKHGRVVPPESVTRKDAEDYAEWLGQRPFSLEGEKLRDGDQPERLHIFEIVRELGTADISAIEERLPAEVRRAHPAAGGAGVDRLWLHQELGRMVLHDALRRDPTLAELRRDNASIGITVFTVTVPTDAGPREVPLEDVFTYRVPEPQPVKRVTIHARLSALSTFWRALAEGSNARGDEPVLRHNVFADVARRVVRGLAAEQRAARRQRARLPPAVLARLLRAAGGPTLADKRDAALLWFLVLSGCRLTETLKLRRGAPPAGSVTVGVGWYDPRALPPAVELVRKGGVRQRLPFPPAALGPLARFQAALEEHGGKTSEPEPGSAVARWRLLSEEPDAPLFPPVHLWGQNSSRHYAALRPNAPLDYRRPMTRHGVQAILRRLGAKAGLSPEEQRLVHGHAFRYLAADAMDRQGMPIRTIQAILGHASVTTTEGYLAPDPGAALVSAQAAVLDYLESAAGVRGETPPPAPAPERPVVETYAVPAPERSEVPEEDELAQAPVPAGAIVTLEGESRPAHGHAASDGVSARSPLYAYEPPGDTLEWTRAAPRTERTTDAATLYDKDGKEMVQQNPFLLAHYDPWPLAFGIGKDSLLPWFARGAASKTGEVTVEVRGKDGRKTTARVPPLPVFAGEQLYSETKAKTLWTRVEALRQKWLRESPTKAFGLDRWWGAFQEIHRSLADTVSTDYRWVPFEADAVVGQDIRAHDDDFLAAWLESNADRYTTTVRAFEGVVRPRGGSERDDAEWTVFREAFQRASLVGVSPAEELPEWFMEDDPVRAIYDADPDEWEWFAKWMGAITGQKLTPERKAERADQEDFALAEREARLLQAKELLGAYFEGVRVLREATKAGDAAEAELQRTELRIITERLASYGVPDPGTTPDLPRPLDARIDTLLRMGFPDAPVELVDPNVLRSALFDRDTFRLDMGGKTIRHTEAFREEFRERYDGRDSECVARRAARGMWEHVKRHGIPVVRSVERSSEYSLLYSVMLSYLAWIVPCPAAVEERMAREFRLGGAEARLRYLKAYRAASARVLRPKLDMDEDALRSAARAEGLDAAGADEVLESALALDSLRAETALPSAPVAAAMARTAVSSGHIAVLRRPRAAVVVARAARRAALEAPKPAATYYSVGPDEDDEEDLTPNAAPRRYLTPNALAEGLRLLERPGDVMPSPLRLMAAMATAF